MTLSLLVKSLSCVQRFATPWTVNHQAPLSMGFSRQEDWSEMPFPSPGGLPDIEIDGETNGPDSSGTQQIVGRVNSENPTTNTDKMRQGTE